MPFSFGQAFVQGHVAAGSGLQGLQFDMISSWPDGSARFGIVSGVAAVSGGVPLGVALGVGTPASGSSLTVAQLKTQLTQAVSIEAGALGSAIWSGSDWDSPLRTWASGPVMSSWIYRKPMGSDRHLVAWLEVRLWSTGTVEVLPWLENGYLNVAAPTNKSATYTVTLGGTQRFSVAFDLPSHCRTALVSGTALSYWLGTDPGVVVRHDADYLMRTEMVPSYYATVSPSAAVVTSQPSTYTPLQQGSYSSSMGTAGYHPTIGMLPEWDVLYLTSSAPSLWGAIQRNAYSAGRFGLYWRDETTNLPARLLDYPNLCLRTLGVTDVGTSTTNTYTPAVTGTEPARFTTQHHPSMGYLAALVTGRYYHVETTQFVAMLNVFKSSDAMTARQGAAGIIKTQRPEYSTRGAAWALRTLGQAAAIAPPGPVGTELLRILSNNVDYYHGRYVAAAHNTFGFTESHAEYTPFGTGVTGSGSTSTVIVFDSSLDNIYKGNVAYDGRYVGNKLVIGGQTRVITAYNGVSGSATVSPAFTVGVALVAFEVGDQVWFNATWMQDFFTAAWGYIKALQPVLTTPSVTKLGEFFAWNAKSVIGRFGLAEAGQYLYRDAVPYTIALAPSDRPDWAGGTGPWFSNWGEVWTATQANSASVPTSNKALGDGSLRNDDFSDDYPENPSGYWANVQPALAYAVRHNVAGATSAYSRMTGAPNWATLRANFNANPVWSVRPFT